MDTNDAREFVRERTTERAYEQISEFAAMLTAESARQNLISPSTVGSMWGRHIADSAQLADYVPRGTGGEWLDIGSGAGLPGIVIACIRMDWRVTLVEPRKLRAEWLSHCSEALGLSNCRIIPSRLEMAEPFRADTISARAVAPLTRLIEIGRRFSTKDTVWVLPKGRSATHDLSALPKPLQPLFHVEQSATDSEAGIIVGRGVEARKP